MLFVWEFCTCKEASMLQLFVVVVLFTWNEVLQVLVELELGT